MAREQIRPSWELRQQLLGLARGVARGGAGAPAAAARMMACVGETGAIRRSIDADVAVVLVAASRVRTLLPEALRLAPGPMWRVGAEGEALHPVVVLAATIDDGGRAHRRLQIAVPWVEIPGCSAHPGPFLYQPRIFVDDSQAALRDELLYGFETAAASIDRTSYGTERAWQVRASSGAVIRMSSAARGEAMRPGDCEAFLDVRQALEMPTLSQARRICDPQAAVSEDALDVILAAVIRFVLEDPSATVVPAEISLHLGLGATARGEVGGIYHSQAIGTDSGYSPIGGFRVRCPLNYAAPEAPATVQYRLPGDIRRRRVVVVGGGPSACAAAYWLGTQPERYEVHLYTLGHRLGGKCAAGRGTSAKRIQEHGLHAFLGFYNNAFRTVRSVWQTAGLLFGEHGEHAFIGSNENGIMIRRNGGWSWYPTPNHSVNLGVVPGALPAEGAEGQASGIGGLLGAAAQRLAAHAAALRSDRSLPDLSLPEGRFTRLPRWLAAVRDDAVSAVASGALRLDAIAEALSRRSKEFAGHQLREALARGPEGPLRWLYEVLCATHKLLGTAFAGHKQAATRTWYHLMNIEVLLTILIGVIKDGVTELDQLDEHDLLEWLKRSGLDVGWFADQPDHMPPPIGAVYETMFAHGDEIKPQQFAAGVGLRWFLLTAFAAEGHIAYKFKYSSSQTLFTPYYRALTRLGVKIHFFHKLADVRVVDDDYDPRIDALVFQRQATLRPGREVYEPLERDMPRGNPDGLPDWPMYPHYDQLVEGEAMRDRDERRRVGGDNSVVEDHWAGWRSGAPDLELQLGRDFDLVVLGVPLGALPPVCRNLAGDRSPRARRWQRALAEMKVTETISMQLWLRPEWPALYGDARDVAGTRRNMLTGYALFEPSFANYAHLAGWEGWRDVDMPTPGTIAYHTGSLTAIAASTALDSDDPEHALRRKAQWKADAAAWLGEHAGAFYSNVAGGWAGLEAMLMIPPEHDGAPLDGQYYNIGVQPWDRYVLSQPAGMAHRMGQGESGYRGLFLCGDWTRTDLNCGSVEAATQSGMLAARAISGAPVYVWRTPV